MKVAILISGQPRNYKQGYESLKQAYLDRYDCDVYIHTWKDTKFEATQFFPNREKNVYQYTNDYISDIQTIYNPVKFLIESPKIFDSNNIIDPIWRQPLQNSKSMWYSIYKCFEQVKNEYDVLIRTRFDLMYEKSLLDLELLNLDKIHLLNWDTDVRVKHRGFYDVFAIGNYTNIGIYSQLYTKLDWYLNHDTEYVKFLQGGWPGQDSGLRNEYLLKWHLINSGLSVMIHETKINGADGQIIR